MTVPRGNVQGLGRASRGPGRTGGLELEVEMSRHGQRFQKISEDSTGPIWHIWSNQFLLYPFHPIPIIGAESGWFKRRFKLIHEDSMQKWPNRDERSAAYQRPGVHRGISKGIQRVMGSERPWRHREIMSMLALGSQRFLWFFCTKNAQIRDVSKGE